jgi:hypothetical protein
MSAATLPLPRAARRPGVGAVYRWELRKLRAQKRTYIGLAAAVAIPLIFILALAVDNSGGGPEELPFSAFVRETGFAIPLVLLLFGSIWLFPLIAALVAGAGTLFYPPASLLAVGVLLWLINLLVVGSVGRLDPTHLDDSRDHPHPIDPQK